MVRRKRTVRTLARHDVSDLIGLPVVVLDAAEEIAEAGDPSGPGIAIPRLEELTAAAAVARCMLPARLKGREVRALRGLLDLKQAPLAAALAGDTVAESISRWEHDSKPVNTTVEKLFRLLVCERLRHEAPGIAYDAVALIGLPLIDRKMPAMEFHQTRTTAGRSIEERWTTDALAVPAKVAA